MLSPTKAVKFKSKIEFFLVEQAPDHVIAKMPVTESMLNPFGTVHAGALLWLADMSSTTLALTKVKPGEGGRGYPLAIDLHAVFMSNQSDGEILAESRFVRTGRRVIVIRTRITGEHEKLLLDVTTTHIPAV